MPPEAPSMPIFETHAGNRCDISTSCCDRMTGPGRTQGGCSRIRADANTGGCIKRLILDREARIMLAECHTP